MSDRDVDAADAANDAAGEDIRRNHDEDMARRKARIARFASWTPGLRIDGSRLIIHTADGDRQLGIVTLGVLNGTRD